LYKRAEKPYGIGTQCVGNGDELDDVQPPLAALKFGNEGLWLAKLSRQRVLPNAGLVPGGDKKRDQTLVFGI